LILTAGMTFGHPPHHVQPRPPVQHFDKSPSYNRGGGTKEIEKFDGGKKKTDKKKVGTKSGNPKKNKKHTKHRKRHHRHGKNSTGGDDDSDDDGADDSADDPEVASGTGLQIIDLADAGPGAKAGLDVDDTILSVNGVRVQSVEELRAVVEKAKGVVTVVFISDNTGDVEEADVTPKHGRLGLTMIEVGVD
jgi:membrane-associated protease RseP (regulator of RpoE activity)